MGKLSPEANREVKGFEQITDLSSAVGLVVAEGANAALIQAETQDVKWRADGMDPTSTVGQLLAAGDSIFYTSDLTVIKFLEVTGGAKLNVHYYE